MLHEPELQPKGFYRAALQACKEEDRVRTSDGIAVSCLVTLVLSSCTRLEGTARQNRRLLGGVFGL